MALDLEESRYCLNRELRLRASEYNGGNSGNRMDYVQVDCRGNTLAVNLGMTLVNRSYASLVESQIWRVITVIQREYDIPYSVSLDWGYVIFD